jgi:cellulose synthase/poly-beta-1,6-N-acetylglucosamine synthase-like glycosyltransferase
MLIGLLLAVVGSIFAVWAVYLVVIVTAALFDRTLARPQPSPSDRTSRIVVVVPAHDEEHYIGRTVRSFEAQTYPRELFEVLVVADNCTDDTAAAARDAGAEVLVRNEPGLRGKGHALQWAIERVLERPSPPDALVVVDADSVADPDFLTVLVSRFEAGAEVVQGESLLDEDGSAAAAMRAAAFLLVNRARPAGRSVLGLPADLSGNGMLFSRRVLLEHPWSAFTSTEDIEYTVRLRLEGIGPSFARGAILRSAPAPNPRAAEEQQLRWEGGQLHLARTYVPRLLARAVRERRPGLVDAAFDLALPPLGFLTAGAVATAAAAVALDATGHAPSWAVIPAGVAVVAIPVYVLVGFRAGRAPRSAYASLLRSPAFVLRKTSKAYRFVRFRADSWVRTERPRD